MHTEKKYSIEYYAHQTTEVGKIQHFDYKDKEDFFNLSYDKNNFSSNIFYQERSIDNPDYYAIIKRLVNGKSANSVTGGLI